MLNKHSFFNHGVKTATTTKNNIYYLVLSLSCWLTGRKQTGTVIAHRGAQADPCSVEQGEKEADI